MLPNYHCILILRCSLAFSLVAKVAPFEQGFTRIATVVCCLIDGPHHAGRPCGREVLTGQTRRHCFVEFGRSLGKASALRGPDRRRTRLAGRSRRRVRAHLPVTFDTSEFCAEYRAAVPLPAALCLPSYQPDCCVHTCSWTLSLSPSSIALLVLVVVIFVVLSLSSLFAPSLFSYL